MQKEADSHQQSMTRRPPSPLGCNRGCLNRCILNFQFITNPVGIRIVETKTTTIHKRTLGILAQRIIHHHGFSGVVARHHVAACRTAFKVARTQHLVQCFRVVIARLHECASPSEQDPSSTLALGLYRGFEMSVHPKTSRTSQTPLSLSSASQRPPQSPNASKTFPSQSHSSTGCLDLRKHRIRPTLPFHNRIVPLGCRSIHIPIQPLLLRTHHTRRIQGRNRLLWLQCCQSCKPEDPCSPRSSGTRKTHLRTMPRHRNCKHRDPCSQNRCCHPHHLLALVEHIAFAIARAWRNAFSTTHTHSSNTLPSQSQVPGAAIPAPPQTPHSSNSAHEPSSSVASKSKLQADSSVHPSFHHITHPIAVNIGFARSPRSYSVELVSVTIAIALRNSSATAFVDGSGTKAHVAFVLITRALFLGIANAVVIQIGRTCSATDPDGVKLVPIAITRPFRKVCATASVDISRTIAHPAGIN